MKVILICALFSACSYLGFQIANSIAKKQKLYFDILDFCRNVKNSVSFLKTDILDIYSTNRTNGDFDKVLDVAVGILENGNQIIEKDFFEHLDKLNFLNNNDKAMLSKMFAEIGNMGYFEQIERMEYYINQFDVVNKVYMEKSGKMQSLSKKSTRLNSSSPDHLVC